MDTSPRSGQIFSLDACKALRPWFAGDEGRTLTLWHVPSRFEWGVQRRAHDVATSLRVSRGPRPRTSQGFFKSALDSLAQTEWHDLFEQASYRGRQFLDLKGPRDKPLKPSTHKGGPWLSRVVGSITACARSCRGITGHAPLGEFCRRFHLEGPTECRCRWWNPVLQTRDHVLRVCLLFEREHHRQAPVSIKDWTESLKVNPAAFAFPPREWDPG